MADIRRHYQAVLLATTTASFITPFTSSSIALALPLLSEEFGVSLAEVNWVANVFLISLASLVLVVGRVSDWFGRGRVFLAGAFLFIITSLAVLITNTYSGLLICRLFQGVAAAMISSTSVAILSDSFPRERRGLAIGINVMAVYLGSSLGPLLGGYIINNFGWRYLFVVKSLVGAVSLILTPFVVDLRGGMASRPDAVRSSLISSSLILIIYGTSNINSFIGASSALLGASLLAYVLLREHVNPKLLHRQILRKKPLAANVAALFNYSATFALTILLSTYLQKVRGLQPSEAGLILGVQPVVQAALSPVAGSLADRYDPSATASLGMFVISVGVGSLMLLDQETPLTNLASLLSILGVGFALFASPNTTAIMNMTPREAYGSATAFLATMRFVGQALSTSIVTSVMRLEGDLLVAIKLSLSIYVLLSITGALFSLLSITRVKG